MSALALPTPTPWPRRIGWSCLALVIGFLSVRGAIGIWQQLQSAPAAVTPAQPVLSAPPLLTKEQRRQRAEGLVNRIGEGAKVQLFSGQADWPRIGEVVRAVRGIPVIGNGDVTQPQHVCDLMAASGCHGVMIGRGALRTPWMFAQASALLRTGAAGPEPTQLDKLRCIRRHIELLRRHHPDEHTVHCMRSRISWYGRTMGHIKPLKEGIRTASTPAQMAEAVDAWMAQEVASLGVVKPLG